jgi:hypothetical protein
MAEATDARVRLHGQRGLTPPSSRPAAADLTHEDGVGTAVRRMWSAAPLAPPLKPSRRARVPLGGADPTQRRRWGAPAMRGAGRHEQGDDDEEEGMTCGTH